MARRLAELAVCGLFGALAGTAIVQHHHRSDALASAIRDRLGVIAWRAEDIAPGGALLIGDSISEINGVTTLCGLPVFNAGIAGSTVSDWLPYAAKIKRMSRPRLIVVALGTNDAWRDKSGAVQWKRRYSELVSSLGGGRIVLVPPPTIEARGAGLKLDASQLAAEQAFVSHGFTQAITAAAVVSFAGHTKDGVHPDRYARHLWRDAIEQAC